MGQKCQKNDEKWSKTVTFALQFSRRHGLSDCFSCKVCGCHSFFFDWTCCLHTEAHKLGLLWTRMDAYWQNCVVLVAKSGYKVNLHFTKRSRKNKNFKSESQQKVPWLHGIDAIAPSNITRSDTMTRIPLLLSEWLKFVIKQARLRFLEKNIFGGRNYITATKKRKRIKPNTRLLKSRAGGQGQW